MANALKQDAPLTEEVLYTREDEALKQQFDPQKKYMFELAEKNAERELPVIDVRLKRPAPHQEFKPYQNIILSSQIVWKGQRRNIRYYDGCTSIFVDEQPKEKETVDLLIAQTRKRFFEKGKFGCHGDERMLLLYLNICSWNANSPFRTRTANQIFVSVNPDMAASLETAKLDETEKALALAKDATTTKMLIHAAYLGVPTVDWESGNDLSEKEIRIAYRKEALANPKNFIDSYGNKTIEIKYYIERALASGLINNKMNPNKACWEKSGTEICDISGLRSPEAIADKLLEHSQTEEGAEFSIQLKSIYN